MSLFPIGSSFRDSDDPYRSETIPVMKKLFLFKAVGEYVGGIAGATANTVEEAFNRISSKFGIEQVFEFQLHTEKYLKEHSLFIRGKFCGYNDDFDWGYVHFLTVFSENDVLFCEVVVKI
jgi:hypothetical protein